MKDKKEKNKDAANSEKKGKKKENQRKGMNSQEKEGKR